MEKKILLIEPPFLRLYKESYSLDRYPLSLGYLAGVIQREGEWEVRVTNADFSPSGERIQVSTMTGEGFRNYLGNLKDLSIPIWQEIRSTIAQWQPSVVGITVKSQNYISACQVAKIVKACHQDIKVILGGPHPSMVGREIFHCPEVDIGVRGEGEQTIVDLLAALGQGKPLHGIRGILYRDGDRIVETPPRELLEDLDSLPFPHEAAKNVLMEYEKYPLTAFKNIFAIRGCPFDCFYCGSRNIWTRRVRFRSPDNILREIKALQSMGLKSIHFDDDTFGINKQYMGELLSKMIRECAGLKWSCEIHVKLVDQETIDLMKSAGCYLIQLGIESGSNSILKAMRKNITIEEALNACEIIKKRGIELQTFFIVGFPQETEETLNETLRAIQKIRSDSIVYNIFTPYPGTEAFQFCKEKGLLDQNFDVSLYNHQSPFNCFCLNLDRETFRSKVAAVERYIDRKNRINRIKRLFSSNLFWRIREKGIVGSLREVPKILLGK